MNQFSSLQREVVQQTVNPKHKESGFGKKPCPRGGFGTSAEKPDVWITITLTKKNIP